MNIQGEWHFKCPKCGKNNLNAKSRNGSFDCNNVNALFLKYYPMSASHGSFIPIWNNHVTNKDLIIELKKRGLSYNGVKTKLIYRLIMDDAYRNANMDSLVIELKRRNLEYGGKKNELIERLHEYDDKVVNIADIENLYESQESEKQETINKAPDFRLLSTAIAFCLTNYYYNGEIHGWEGVIGAVIVGVIYSVFTFKDNSKKKLIDNSASISNLSETTDIPDQIKKLSDLKDQGILTEEEFQNKKKDLLDKM